MPEYKPISEFFHKGKPIQEILENHEKWLDKKNGEWAEFSKADLSAANLSRANLNWADLSAANLSEANFSAANLSKADLSRADLSAANLSAADLSEANLSRANLSAADLSEARLSGADLSKANLSKANLIADDLSSARISEANLSGADLSRARLSEANLSGADLSEARLSGADLGKANLSKANLSKADLSEARLSEARLSGADLGKARLSWTDLSEADLSEADLSEANLSRADLSEANLSGADLSGADLSAANLIAADLSGALINELTTCIKVEGCQVGVNGLYSEKTDSAALMALIPPGNSMQGSNPVAVLESLKRARRLHGFSMSLVGIVLLIIFFKLTKIYISQMKLDILPENFLLLAMPLSIGVLSLVNTFLADGLKGARFLNDRQSAMTVGNFPWTLSKFAGSSWINKIQSFITRLVMSFHPLVYLYYYGKWDVFDKRFFYIVMILLIIISCWTFIISQRFQKPILFDSRAEEQRLDNIDKLTKAVETQTEIIIELVDIFKPKQNSNTPNGDQ